MYICYVALNINTLKQYVGITKQPLLKRWKNHCDRARTNPTSLFHRSIAKHGTESFILSVVSEGISREDIGEVERLMIAEHDSYYTTGHGYNLTLGGEGASGRTLSIEVRQRISEKKTGRKHTEQTKQRIRQALLTAPLHGHRVPHTEEAKLRMSAAHTGKRLTDETKRKMSLARAGKPRPESMKGKLRGKPRSEETKRKISEARRRRTETQ